jgi:hypothetical protein
MPARSNIVAGPSGINFAAQTKMVVSGWPKAFAISIPHN